MQICDRTTQPTVVSFELLVNDGNTNSAPDIVEITINHVNLAPIADAGPDQVVNERTTVSLSGSGSSDPDSDPLTYLWRQISGPTVALSDPEATAPTFDAPEVNEATVLSFELVVNDGSTSSAPDLMQVTVNHVNPPPHADAGPDQVVNEETPVQLDGSESSDPDGEPITYLWRRISGPAVTLSDATAVNPTFVAPEVSVLTVLSFELKVNDGNTDSAPDVVEITVNRVNKLPTSKAGPNQVVDERTTVLLDGSASSDPDGDTLSYKWKQLSGPVVNLSNITTATPSFVALEVTESTQLSFELIVNDSEADSGPDVVEITVNHVNRAPIADAGLDQVVDRRTNVSLNGRGSSDLDGDTLTFSWRQVSGPVVTLSDPNTAAPSFVAPESQGAAELRFELVVSDRESDSDATTVTVSVRSGFVSDMDNSGRVDGFDLGRVGLAFGSRPRSSNWDPLADLNQDGVVDKADLDILSVNFGRTR